MSPIIEATNRFVDLSAQFSREFNRAFYLGYIAPEPKPLGLRSMKKFNRLLEKELKKQPK